jgi:hypothetical protein
MNKPLLACVWAACFLSAAGIARGARETCPETPDLTELMRLYDRAVDVTALQFIKIEKEPTDINSWRFRVAALIKSKDSSAGENVSFFAKPDDAAPMPPRFNDRFVTFNERKNGLPLASALKSTFLAPANKLPGFCIYRSSVYMEDLIKQAAEVEPTRDRACRIQLVGLEDSPTIKESLAFRCQNPELERKRLVILANSYASARRYGNATTALELSNGTLNANTLSIVIGWADKWEETDDRAAKRFVERILNPHLRAHMEKTKQMPAIIDILNDKKRYKSLRDTDWFEGVITKWIESQPSPTPTPNPKPANPKTVKFKSKR